METTPPKVILIAGPNGAGKSTLAPSLLRSELGILDYVDADTIARGLSAFAPERAAFAAGRIMLQQLRTLAKARRSFAFESTLATRSYAPWLTVLQADGYLVEVIFLWIRSSELAVNRVEQRVRRGGHAVDPVVIRRRYERGPRNFVELYAQIADQWIVLDNSSGPPPLLIAIGGRERNVEIRDAALWATFHGEHA